MVRTHGHDSHAEGEIKNITGSGRGEGACYAIVQHQVSRFFKTSKSLN
jgi:hypothetical protein